MSPAIQVAVAVVQDEAGRVLITQRPLTKSHGGFWEFPGGKLEDGELAEQALCRELDEEVGLTVLTHQRLGRFSHQYDQYMVDLIIFRVKKYHGEAVCKEGQGALRWVALDQLSELKFPAANYKIIEMLQPGRLG